MREYTELPKRTIPQRATPEELEDLKKRGPDPLAGKALDDFRKVTARRERDLDYRSKRRSDDYARWKDLAWEKYAEGGPKRGQRIKVTYDVGHPEAEGSLEGKIVYVDDPIDVSYIIVKPDRGKNYYHIVDSGGVELEGDTPDTFYWTLYSRNIF